MSFTVLSSNLSKCFPRLQRQKALMTRLHTEANNSQSGSKSRLRSLGRIAAYTGAFVGGLALMATPVFASDLVLAPPKLPWPHFGVFKTHDHGSVRRGYQVYKEVCSACHGLHEITYFKLVGAVLTGEEALEHAKEATYIDGPDENGKMFEREGKLSDTLPSPYPNDEAAAVANDGAVPPDLSKVVMARDYNEDYIFHLLTGYHDAPEGYDLPEGKYYNPYFPGGAIAMAQALYDEIIEYNDGTPATCSQMAKDVTNFLAWTVDPYLDQRKRFCFKAALVLGLGSIAAYMAVRKDMSILKTRKVYYKPRPRPKDM